MAQALTYTSLVERIKKYVQRTDDDFVEEIPSIVAMAQQRIAREVKVLGLQSYVSSSFTPGNGVYEGNGVIKKPARWRETITLSFGSGAGNHTRNQLYLRTYDFCRSYHPDPAVTGTPMYYCDYGFDHFLVVPTPSQAFPFELSFYQLPEPLDDSNQTNWLTENAPDLLLYACLLESATFARNADKLQSWENKYRQAAAALGGEQKMQSLDSAASVKG